MTSALRRFVRAPAADRALFVRALAKLAVARVALWILPFATARRLVVRRPPETPRPLTREQVRWAVDTAQRFIPDATCLPQALTAESLLLRGGHPVQLRIGVRKTAGRFDAHAWVESGGYVVVGRLPWGLAEYTVLPPLPSAWDTSAPRPEVPR